jgi:hypothetical protein
LETVAVKLARRFSEVWSVGDIDAAAALFHPEGVIVSGVLAGPGETFAGGPEAVRAAFDRARERWADFTLKERSYEPGRSPDLVLVRSVLSARPHGTPLESEWTSWGVFTVHEGMIHSFRVFHTEEEGRLAAGLSPADDVVSPFPRAASGVPRPSATRGLRRPHGRLGATQPASARPPQD